MTVLNLLIINLLIILIIDLSGFVPSLKRLISKTLTKNKINTDEFRIKPFDCSYCMTFWCLMLYLLIIGEFTLPYLFTVIVITHFTDVTKQLMVLSRDLLIKLINKIYEKVID